MKPDTHNPIPPRQTFGSANRAGRTQATRTPGLLLANPGRAVLSLMLAWCSTLAATSVFGQTTYTWTGAGDGTNLANAANWDLNALPSGASQDTGQWDGQTTTNLIITYGSTSLPSTGFGSQGINLVLTPNQVNSVEFLSSVAQSAVVGVFGVTNASTSATLTFGDTNTARLFNIIGRPAGVTHYWVNNSTNPASINQSVRWQAGGGNAYTLEFGGTGDWILNNYLRNDNGSGGTTVTVDGPGTTKWTAAGFLGRDAISGVNINGGKLVLASSGLLGNQAITNNATLVFDAPAQSQSLGGVISGTGLLQVNRGTLTLAGDSTYVGNTVLNGGEVILNRAENVGNSGPLGVGGTISFNGGTLGFSVNNTFDYSSRFSTAANQAFSIDTAGQSVTFSNALASSGGTLTKVGPGTLTVAGTNSYTGDTMVSAGRLVFQGSKPGAGNITVADSAALGVTATGTPIAPATLTVGTSGGAILEFNEINSTTSAPLSAGAVSAAGTITININSGTINVGQSYPLLAWSSGSAPAVSLGVLNGYTGNLSTNANTIQVNITGTAFTWTGANNGNWDTNTANNWVRQGASATFADGGPVLFDDTGAITNVTVNSLVEPAGVTVNNESKGYSIASSGGNNIGGTQGLLKSGGGTLTVSGGANTYSGPTTISGGTLRVAALANGGSPSDLGASSSSAANLVLNGGTLQYTGAAAAINRLFTLGTGGGTIDSSGSGALSFNNSDVLGLNGSGPRALTLTGAETDNNTLAAAIADNGGPTTLSKSGAGKWVLAGTNSYSGATTVASGILQVGTGGDTGSLGSGNVVNNGTLDFNRTGSLTVGTISGTGSVTNDGTGTVILPGNNSYSGGTTINAGTLQVGDGGGTGTLDANAGVVNNGTLVFNSTAAFNLNGVISGSGQLIKQGPGLLKLLGAETYTGATTVAAGAQLQVCSGNQGALASPAITNDGTVIFVRQDNGIFIYAGNISGTGSVIEDVNNPNPGDTTLTGTNSYTGGTYIQGGGIILGDGGTPGAGAILGDVIFTNSLVNDTARTLTFNRPDDFTFSGKIVGGVVLSQGAAAANAGSVVQNGSGTLTFTGLNTYPAGTTINAGTIQVGNGGTSGTLGTGTVTDNSMLVFNRSDSLSFPAVITGTGSVVQQGSGVLTLLTNSYTGSTTVSNGTLVVNGDNTATSTFVYGGTLGGTGSFFGPITLATGTTLAPGGAPGSLGTLIVNSDLTLGGNLAIDVDKSRSPSNDVVLVTGALSETGTGTLTVANLGPNLAVGDKFTLFSQPLLNGAGLTVTGGGATWVNNLAVDGSIKVASVLSVTPPPLNFSASAGNNSLQFSWSGGFKLQAQTNGLSSTGWADYPGGGTSPVAVPVDTTKGAVFFRLVSAP